MYHKSAIISKCGLYRYELRRIWQPKTGLVCWVMLNPSTADANNDDPTIRRCMGYAARWGYGGIVVVNLFALRCTDSSHIPDYDDAVGKGNNRYIKRASAEARLTMAGWGIRGRHLGRDKIVLAMLIDPHYLALTKNRSPRHPLYSLKGLDPVKYEQVEEMNADHNH